MSRVELVKQVERYFSLRELIDEPTYKKYGAFAWNFFDTRLLEVLFALRNDIIKKPMTVNTWMTGGKFDERGLRTNLSSMIQAKTKENKLSMSAHSTGKGVDFDAKGMTAAEVRMLIQQKAHMLPHPIRLEDAVNWVHIDVYNDGAKSQVVLFKV